jgi:hypothetical protein
MLDVSPQRFHIVVNTLWPSTSQVLASGGTFRSAAFEAMRRAPTLIPDYESGRLDYLPFVQNPTWLGQWSVPGRSVSLRYRLDHDAELVRRQHFPAYPSRLSAVFAFADEDSCRTAASSLAWDLTARREFELLPNPRNRVVRLNMHAYTAARNIYMTECDITPEEREQLWLPYWRGESPPLSPLPDEYAEPLWEYLIEGELRLVTS